MSLFELKTKIYFGKGERDRLPQYLLEHNFARCGIVIDEALLSFRIFNDMITKLKKELKYLKILIYDYKGEPTYGYLDIVKTFFKQDEIECLVGIGGGSTIDVTKGLAILVRNPVNKSVELRGFPKIENLPIPVVTVPTVSGTGTEVTYNAVFIDESEKRKLGINTTLNFPAFSLLDPELTLSAPLKKSLSSALDCLVHSLESFMSKKATQLVRLFSIEAFYNAFFGLQKLLKDPRDVIAREKLMIASSLGGIALMNSSSGAAGAFSYPLGTFFGVPHGLAGAFFIQYILRYNFSKGYNDLYILYDRISTKNSMSREKKNKRLIQKITALIGKAGVSKRLSDFGVKKEDIPNFIKQVVNYLWGSFETNPVSISKEELNNFLEQIA